jgi:hypothetical protein
MTAITVSEDLPNCPQCGAPAVKDDERGRHCNSCGLSWQLRTEADELDLEADKLVRSRGWNEEQGRARDLGRVPHRW